MAPAPESSAGPVDRAVANDYDSFAEAYTADRSQPHQRLLRAARDPGPGRRRGRPADPRRRLRRRPLAAALRDRGATVTGFDSSIRMLELARQRLGADADLHLADVGSPLPFTDGAFDDVIASLVLHYLEDWTAPLAELRRVLTPGGRLIMSVYHPIVFKLADPGADYFATQKWSEETTFSGQIAVLTYWHRPLHAMNSAFTTAGFRIAVLSEPAPAPAARELFPADSRPGRGFCASSSSSWRPFDCRTLRDANNTWELPAIAGGPGSPDMTTAVSSRSIWRDGVLLTCGAPLAG